MIKKSFRKYFSGISKNTILLALSSLFTDIATEMLYPILPIFLTQSLHVGGSIVGLIEDIAQATQNITQAFSSWLSDKIQKRKPIALVIICHLVYIQIDLKSEKFDLIYRLYLFMDLLF